jgi:hypothetical protein
VHACSKRAMVQLTFEAEDADILGEVLVLQAS